MGRTKIKLNEKEIKMIIRVLYSDPIDSEYMEQLNKLIELIKAKQSNVVKREPASLVLYFN